MLTVGLHTTQQLHNVEKQSRRENLHCNNYVDHIRLILEKRTLQQL